MNTAADFLAISPRIRVLPIIHGSGDFAIRVREELLARPYDCVAVPLPPSFQDDVEAAIELLPTISLVAQLDVSVNDSEDEEPPLGFNYVPIDPCQGVIAALRLAMGERMTRAFVAPESPTFEGGTGSYPDPYALKRVSAEGFAAAMLPAIPAPKPGQPAERVAWMAARLRELEREHRLILLVCSLEDWPWVRDAYQRQVPLEEPAPFFAPVQTFGIDPRTLVFLLGELPFLTALYERGRSELTPDDNLSVDGVKELVLHARDALRQRLPKVADRITPQLLSVMFRYVRNLALLGRRLTPDMYDLVVAAQQVAGGEFALAVGESARAYPHGELGPFESALRMGMGKAEVPGWGIALMTSRLPGQAIHWRSCQLIKRPEERDRKQWRQSWNPHGMCSWPPEDDRIESFQRHVRDQAKAILGADLARSEKFTSSVMDGLDIRETLRNWHSGDLYVKVLPPARGSIEVVVFLFDCPADPERYVNRATWYAEHLEESTLVFYSTDPMKNMVGPGIAQAEYGGAMFLFPPRPIPDPWLDRRLDFADTLEDRLIAAACLHSREKHVAVVSARPPSAGWRRLARKYGRKIIHLPLGRFGGQMLERLRTFHVLNGRTVRSYASDFIRDS
jgi:hypothetical protein